MTAATALGLGLLALMIGGVMLFLVVNRREWKP